MEAHRIKVKISPNELAIAHQAILLARMESFASELLLTSHEVKMYLSMLYELEGKIRRRKKSYTLSYHLMTALEKALLLVSDVSESQTLLMKIQPHILKR